MLTPLREEKGDEGEGLKITIQLARPIQLKKPR